MAATPSNLPEPFDFMQSITMSALRAVQRRLTDETEAGV